VRDKISREQIECEAMGIVITWSMIFVFIAVVIAILVLTYFLFHVASKIAGDANEPDVSVHPKVPTSHEGTSEFSEATVEAFRRKVPKFGRRHSLPSNPSPLRSFFHHYRPAHVTDSWKHHGAAALKKMTLLHTSLGLQHRFRKGLIAFRKIASQSGRFIFIKFGGLFRRLGLNVQNVRPLFLKQLGRG